MEKLLSIVIPAYNVEQYIGRCLASLEIKEILQKIEVLIINDGSTDQTAEIAKKFCDRHPNTFYIFNKANGGHGSGINYGIRHANGHYFKVLDGDDWINSREFPAFLDYIDNMKADVIATDFLCVQDRSNKVMKRKNCTDSKQQYGKILRIDRGEIKNFIRMHSLTIRTEILQSNNIHIDENSFYVDYEYITYPFPYVKTIICYPKAIYIYRLERSGQSVSVEKMQRNRVQHKKVLYNLLRFYKERERAGDGKNLLCYIAKVVADMEAAQVQILLSMPLCKIIKRELIQLENRMLQQCPSGYKCCRKKSIWLLRWSNYHLYMMAWIVWKILHK